MRIALSGNPNSGKTTMYNALTGRNERVGNWAGVTVDKKEAELYRQRGNSGRSARCLLYVTFYIRGINYFFLCKE